MADQVTLPGTLPATPPAPPALSHTTLTPREAAIRAAETRAALPPSVVHSDPATSHRAGAFSWDEFNPPAGDKLPFHRLLDSELLAKTLKPQAVKTIEMCITVISNILEPPEPHKSAKYRQLRTSNAQIKRNIIDVAGAWDYLIAAGFRRSVMDYTEYLIYPPAPSSRQLYTLRVALLVLNTVVTRAREAEARENRYRESEKEAQARRKQTALLGFEEDRRLKREKDERERIGREARAKLAAEQAARDAAAQALAQQDVVDAHHPLFQGGQARGHATAAATMDVQDADDDDDGDGDGVGPPPGYGRLDRGHGRVLGTGQAVGGPPPGVRMVHAHMEDDDSE